MGGMNKRMYKWNKKRKIHRGSLICLCLLLTLSLAFPVYALPAEASENTPDFIEEHPSGETMPGDPNETEGETMPGDLNETESETGNPIPETDAPEVPSNLPLTFQIDDIHKYQGMSRTYQEGYLPAVENGKAILILPLLTDQEVLGKTVTVTPELGSTENSPFIYRNYQKTISETQEIPVDEKDPITLYLVRLELDLSSKRYNGVYSVGINIQARDRDGMSVSQRFTTYITITDGKSTEVQSGAPQETKPESDPFLYVEKYTVLPEPVVAGEEFTVKALICNTHKKQDVKNIRITASSGTDALTLLEDSNVFFWEELAAGESRELTLRYKADNNMTIGKYHILLNIEFEDEEAMSLAASGDVTITVTQPMRLEAEYPIFTSGANAGDTISLNFQAVNMGMSEVYNVRFELDAPGLIPSGSAYIGNLGGGTAGSAEMKVFVGAKSMNRELEEGEEPYGHTSGNMVMIYEDENGNEYREEQIFSTTIYELVIGTSAPVEEETDSVEMQWWIAIAGGAVIIIGIGAAAAYRKKKSLEAE